MTTYKDIRKSINTLLKSTGVEVNSRDVSEGFIRPSFFVQLDNVDRKGYESQVHKSMTVRIYFFPTDRYEYSIEVLEMQEELERLFDLKLPVKDRLLNIDEFTTVLNDGVLNCSFDLEFYEARTFIWNKEGIEPDFEPMEELELEKE